MRALTTIAVVFAAIGYTVWFITNCCFDFAPIYGWIGLFIIWGAAIANVIHSLPNDSDD